MRIKRIKLKGFKRFTDLVIDNIPESAKLVVIVGPNGSGKTSLIEALNHYYKYYGFRNVSEYSYLRKAGKDDEQRNIDWHVKIQEMIDVQFHDIEFSKNAIQDETKNSFCFRSAYRNEPDIRIDSIQRQKNPTENIRLQSLIQNDSTVSNNYLRLITSTISGVHNDENSQMLVGELRDKLTGRINESMKRIFGDLELSSLGDPFYDGSFYFTKGQTKDFGYQNLSAGEKAAFDLILDMVIQSNYCQNAIYCIDEPEAHMHTRMQGRVLHELYTLIPGDSQLWISTHSIGMIKEAEELEEVNPGAVVFLDFDNRDFDEFQFIQPAVTGRKLLNKFYELAFDDFAKLMLPETVVICEGDSLGGKRKDFDKSVYSRIFEKMHPKVVFLSGGACNDIENIEETHGGIIRTILGGSTVIKVIDRDDRSEEEIVRLNEKGIKVLKRRNLESYLLDDSMIAKLCESLEKEELYKECLEEKRKALNGLNERKKSKDDLKSASGDICNKLKLLLGITQGGNSPDAFMRDTVAPLMTPDMEIYKELENDIFG